MHWGKFRVVVLGVFCLFATTWQLSAQEKSANEILREERKQERRRVMRVENVKRAKASVNRSKTRNTKVDSEAESEGADVADSANKLVMFFVAILAVAFAAIWRKKNSN